MNSNAKAIELASSGEGAVAGSWQFTSAPATFRDGEQDGAFMLTTVVGQVLAAKAMMCGRIDVLEYMLHECSLDGREL